MAVLKQKITGGWTQLRNEVSRNQKIGYRAVGLMAYVFSFSNKTRVLVPRLITEYDSIGDVRNALHVLCHAGYAQYIEARPRKGQLDSYYNFSQFQNEDWQKEYMKRVKGKPKLNKRVKRGRRKTDVNLLNQKPVTDSVEISEEQRTKGVKKIDLDFYKAAYSKVFNFCFNAVFEYDKTHEKALSKISEIIELKSFIKFLLVSYIHVGKKHDKMYPSYLLNQINSIRKKQVTNYAKLQNLIKKRIETHNEKISLIDAKMLRVKEVKEVRELLQNKLEEIEKADIILDLMSLDRDVTLSLKEQTQADIKLTDSEIKEYFIDA